MEQRGGGVEPVILRGDVADALIYTVHHRQQDQEVYT